MIYIGKKEKLVILSLLAVIMLAAVFAAAVPKPTSVTAQPVILIDPGHGGVDGGAVGITGAVEKDINLQIALRLRDVLTRAGFVVIMTREDDRSIHDSSAQTVREQKVSDLRNRLAMTELYPDSVLISIHQNTLSDSSVKGAQVFFSPNAQSSRQLAQCVQDSFNAQLNDRSKEIKQAGKNLYLFYYAKNTAILAECGFLSNSDEESHLRTEEYQDKIVFAIYKGLLEYLKMNKE